MKFVSINRLQYGSVYIPRQRIRQLRIYSAQKDEIPVSKELEVKMSDLQKKQEVFQEQMDSMRTQNAAAQQQILGALERIMQEVQVSSNETNDQEIEVDGPNMLKRFQGSLQEFVILLETSDIVDGIVFEVPTNKKAYKQVYIDIILHKPLQLKRVIIQNNTSKNGVRYLRFIGKGNLIVEESLFDGIGIMCEAEQELKKPAYVKPKDVNVQNDPYHKLQNVFVKNAPGNGLQFNYSQNLIELKKVDLTYCGGEGIRLFGCSHVELEEIRISNCSIGFFTKHSIFQVKGNNLVQGCRYSGIEMQGSKGTYQEEVTFRDNGRAIYQFKSTWEAI
eukprot:TRINITY_DN6092_c0_g2_i5.p1 TRINITY_DN6092_c0_g2~~TRINITY_DN6092_c0_g2_i5.p1  ORF type:complete len:333 (+),score=20.11 TRINITY_DN6092_c0_g2_i5:127-1125(+)